MLDKDLIKLVEEIKNSALQKNYTISTAESCTGGLISGYLTSVPGSSIYFTTGIVTYSNEGKVKLLKVPKFILKKFGAVSEETAKYMAIGVQNISDSNIAIAVTGIAGPDGGSATKPVGIVCFGLYANNIVTSTMCQFSGSREEIRFLACKQALLMILDHLKV